ncbi:MAG: hypothetical protein QOJ73_5042, partial [Streptosporangiaceae bacterium]|nr:hypothetical protein [Streptosporangiaceae bacterium]
MEETHRGTTAGRQGQQVRHLALGYV